MDCNFSTPTCGTLTDVYSNGQVTTDSTAPLSPSSVLNQLLPPGATQGGAQLDKFFGNATQVYVGLYIKTNTEFTLSHVGIGKLFFVGGPLSNSYFAYFGGYGDFDKTVIYNNQNGGDWNNCHLTGAGGRYGDWPGGFNFLGNINGSSLARGQWHKIEFLLKHSTTATSRDGIVRWWVDGVLRGNYTTLNQHTYTNYFSLNHTWDGAGNVVPGKLAGATWQHLFDQVRVSTCVSSCDQGVTPDTTPPGQVTSVTVTQLN